MAGDWDDVKKAAMQILGAQGKIPDPPSALRNTAAESAKSWAEFKAVGKSLKDALDKHEQKFGNYIGAETAYVDDLDKDNLGLDPKSKEDAKKIVAARKLLAKYRHGLAQQHEKEYIDMRKKLDPAVKLIMDAQ